LVPLSAALPLDDSVTPINQVSHDQLQNVCMEVLPELPCEVEIKEMNADPSLNDETAICEALNIKRKTPDAFECMNMKKDISIISDTEEKLIIKTEYQTKKEGKRLSILEQVLTGSLTVNNHQQLQPKQKLTSEWWCAPCNSYYK